MKEKTGTLIYNPHAGFGSWRETMRKVADLWNYHGWDITLQPTQRAHHATQLAKEAAAAGQTLVLAAGGDGTLNEVANGLAHTETILGLLPVGTGNSFARELRLPPPNLFEPYKLLEASEMLLAGNVQRMDLGYSHNGRYWLLWAGTGADGYVIEHVEPRSKLFKRIGRAGYAAKALFFLPGFAGIHATITIDDRPPITDEFLLINISNCRLFGGGEFTLNATGLLDDGLFEVWLFRGGDWPTLELMRYILEVGLENHVNNPRVDLIRAKKVTVTAVPPTAFHVDAEPSGKTPFTCQIHPQALRLLVPQTAPDGLFQESPLPLTAVVESEHSMPD